MSEQIFNTRIVHKHDTAENWEKAVNFTPKAGELIIYDIDSNFDYPRIKMGDGIRNVNMLPFIDKGINDKIDGLSKIIAVDDGEGNIELKPFLTHEGLLSSILEGEY